MGFRLLNILIATACALSLGSCGKEPPTLFREVPGSQSGVQFSNDLIETEDFNMIDYLYFYNGGGVAVGDINNDGLIDIYLSANQGENKLYLNKGDWTFEDITATAGVASAGAWKTGVAMADVNGDGLLDIYQCRLGNYKGIQDRNELYINNGDLTFSEQAATFGLDFQGFSTQAAFFDYDLDGDLDVYLLNHSVHTERSYGKASLRQYDDGFAGDRLFKNNGGFFRSVTKESGIYSSHIGYGLGVGIADVNNDGWPDIYISNDFNENDYLYLNRGASVAVDKLHFEEVSEKAFGHTSRFSMGSDLADYNNDGLIDIMSLDMLPEDEGVIKRSAGDDSYEIYALKLQFGYGRQFTRNMLQLNNGTDAGGDISFAEIGQLAGVHATDWSWSTLLADFDNDGLKDLFISNGIRRRPNDMDYINFLSGNDNSEGLPNNAKLTDLQLIDQMPDGAVPNYFFRNNGDLTFSDQSKFWSNASPTLSNGAAYADFDNDGDLDLLVNNLNQQAGLLRNYTMESDTTQPAFLRVSLKGAGANSHGIGARIIVYGGGQVITQENFTTRGFQSTVAPVIHIGLGKAKKIDSLRVIWPGGRSLLLQDVACGQMLQLKEADATLGYEYPSTGSSRLINDVTTRFSQSFQHTENSFNDFNREFLLPHMISREGPALAVADVDQNGSMDFFLGNASGSSSLLIFQTENGDLEQVALGEEILPKEIEVTGALFFDANGDGYADLYIASAGNESIPPSETLLDRLLINNGKGSFDYDPGRLPMLYQHGSVAVSADVDGDGDLDLFVGGRIVAGRYGEYPESYLLLNDGKGYFSDATSTLAPGISEIGMVTDALWTDLNADDFPELIVVGEWMPITIFANQGGILKKNTTEAFSQSHGWWKCLEAGDFDNDGDVDFVAGNMGVNTRHRPSREQPLHLFVRDFDENGANETVMGYSTPDGIFPINTRDELIKQLPVLKKKYIKHADFAEKTVDELFGADELAESLHRLAYTFESAYIENKGNGVFEMNPLPIQAQFSPVKVIEATDLNNDGNLDLLLGGNEFFAAPYFGSYDAGKGLILLGDGKGEFKPMSSTESGFFVNGEIRDIKTIESGEKLLIVIARNNDKLLIYTPNGQ